MELAQIRHVLAVVDEGGFTRAADVLRMSQPSLSQSVKRLEDELGVALFQRLGRTVRPTEAGTDFVGPARAVLRDMDVLHDAVRHHVELSTGTLHVGSLPSLAVSVLAPLVGKLRASHPGVSVRVADDQIPDRLVDMVADGRCELVFIDAPRHRPGVTNIAFGEQELFAVMPPGSPAGQRRMPLAEFGRHPLVVGPVGTAARELLVAALVDAGHTPEIVVEIPQRDAIVALVLAGAGSTVLPGPAAEVAAASGAVVRALAPSLGRPVTIAHRDRDLSPQALAFLELARRSKR